MDDSLDLDEQSGNEFDNSGIVVRTVNILGMNWFREGVSREVVFLDESPIKAVN